METNTDSNAVHILGYRMIEKIGAGGYGEVWKAEAPGGLPKAIKILYGYHDERRAQMELKSLERVKQLRHPFLLSLERIDVVEGQMIVITELADRSLADVFDAYVAQGQPGIPRDELIRYLSQVAEALDYLALEHSLQHLDVKPENFLISGQHAKLADFGLVKDLHTMNQSLLGGMTPSYAAPELFDGKPSLTSDQYGLAIVYQEMLTGERPFTGSSAAQLAAQHMHGKPNLRNLPTNDQPVIAKALGKDPLKRFKSCKEMMDELAHRKTLVKSGKKVIAPSRKSSGSTLGPGKLHQIAHTNKINGQWSQEKVPLRFADAPTQDNESATFSPVLFLGVGQMGTRILHGLKKRIEQQLGPIENLPSIGLLALDSDRSRLFECGGEHNSSNLSHREVLALPLRRPEEYRERTKSHTQWLNRRWIYNVPKSLQTEGLRPLGRLAVIDNFESVWERLNGLMEQISTPEAMARTLENLELAPGRLHPRICLVGAISGGIGGGSLLDLAYMCKTLLLERGFPTHNVLGILLHGVDSKSRDSGVTVANTFAFLAEMRQFIRDGYPGESTCGVPDMPGDSPFEHAYLLDFGTNSSSDRLNTQLGQAADYLFLSNLSPCRAFFEKCREMDQDREHFTFRSFEVCSAGLGYSTEMNRLANYFVEQILAKWTGATPAAKEPLGDDTWINIVPTVEAAGTSLEAHLNNAIPLEARTVAVGHAIQLISAGQPAWKQPVDKLFNAESDSTATSLATNWFAEASSYAKRRLVETEQALRRQLLEGFLQERLHLSTIDSERQSAHAWTQRQVQFATEQLEALEQQLNQFEASFNQQIVKRKDKSADSETLRRLVESYVAQRQSLITARSNLDFFKGLSRFLDELKVEFDRIRLRLTAAAKFHRSKNTQSNDPIGDRTADVFLQALIREQEQILARIELRLYHETVVPRGTYWDIVQDASCLQAQLMPAVAQAALAEVVEVGRSINLDRLYESGAEQSKSWESVTSQLLSQRLPMIADNNGGVARVLLGLPKGSRTSIPRQMIQEKLQVQIAETNLNSGDIAIATEIDELSLADFAMDLYQQRTDCIELASRLQSRNDVKWSPLQELL